MKHQSNTPSAWFRDVTDFSGTCGRIEFLIAFSFPHLGFLLLEILELNKVQIELTVPIFLFLVLFPCMSLYFYFSTICRRCRAAGLPLDCVVVFILSSIVFMILISKNTDLFGTTLIFVSLTYWIGFQLVLLIRKSRC